MWKTFSPVQKIEIVAVLLTFMMGALTLFGIEQLRFAVAGLGIFVSVFWLINSLRSSYFGEVPFYSPALFIPLSIIPAGIVLKVAVMNSGAFILFVGLVLSVIGLAMLFVLVLTSKKHLKYLKNSAIRLVPATTIGVIIYFTPQVEIIRMVYAGNPDKMHELEKSLAYPYEAKPKKQTIVFVTDRTGNSDIVEINEDGTGLNPLLASKSDEWSPRMHPDGVHLYFLRDEEGYPLLCRKNLESDSIEIVSELNFDDIYFQFHPGGDAIIYHDTLDGFYQVFKLDLTNGEKIQLTNHPSNNSKPMYLDEERFVFQSDREGNMDIFLSFSGSDSLINLTNTAQNERNPIASPYGDVIVFHSDRDSLRRQNLYYQVLETGEVGQLTDSPALELIANFSPKAKKLVFGSNRDGNWEIYLMKNTGEFLDRLTNHPGFDGDAIWIEKSFVKK
jgi:TolB protein